MSDVTLTVGGRHYTVACADGQEDHVRRLSKIVDSKLTQMGKNLSTSDAKNLLFAALMLADEADEARQQAATASQAAQSASPPIDDDRMAGRLERIARALENAASTLESD